MTHRVHMYIEKNASGRLPKAFSFHEIPDPNVTTNYINQNNLHIKSCTSFSDLHIEIPPQHGPTFI